HAIAVDPDNDQYRYQKGLFLFNLNRVDEAIDFFTQCIAINSSHMNAFYKRGLAYHRNGEFAKAAQDLKQAYNMSSTNYAVTKGLADALSALKDYSNAKTRYEEAIKFSEKEKGIDLIVADMYDSLGKTYIELTDYGSAIGVLQKA